MTRWLITGGCGFIGRNLIQHLLAEGGHQILIIDNLSVGTKNDLKMVCDFQLITPKMLSEKSPGVQMLVEDVLNADLAVRAARNCDIIVHLAANTGVPASVVDPRKDCTTNVMGTFNYLEAARVANVKRFVFASSGAPAGLCTPPIHEEIAAHPISPYGASKLAGEGYCSAFFHSYGIETVSLRFGNVYGPLSSRKNSVVAKFIKRVFNGKILEIYGDGSQTRDFIYIDDLVNAIRKAAVADGIGGEIFQIATAREITISEMTDKLVAILKEMGVSESVTLTHVEERVGDLKRNFSDTRKALEKLNWQAKVNLDDGLRKSINWFLRNRAHLLD